MLKPYIVLLLGIMLVVMPAAAQSSAIPITVDNAAQVTEVAVLEGHTGPVFTLDFSPDSALLVSGGSGDDFSVRLWDVASASETFLLEGHEFQIAAVTFNADGTQIESASYDETINLWDAATGGLSETIDQTDTGETLGIANLSTVFTPDGSKLVYTNDIGINLWLLDIATRQRIDLVGDDMAALAGNLGAFTISADGSMIAASDFDGNIHLIDVASASEIQILTPAEFAYYNLLVFSPDGNTLAAADFDTQAIQLWDVETGEAGLLLSGHEPNTDGTLGIYGMAWSPDGTMLASVSYDQTTRLWDASTGEELISLSNSGDGSAVVAWSPDGAYVATANLDGSIQVWGIAA